MSGGCHATDWPITTGVWFTSTYFERRARSSLVSTTQPSVAQGARL
ncbi:MAG: hypothetical protein ACXWG8_17705 [Usitatibacter sp.]